MFGHPAAMIGQANIVRGRIVSGILAATLETTIDTNFEEPAAMVNYLE